MVKIRMPTPEEDAAITAAAESDPDNPPLTDEELRSMRWGAPEQWAGERARTLLREAIADLEAAHESRTSAEPAMEKLRAALAELAEDTAHAAE